jgi:TolA-binding protein
MFLSGKVVVDDGTPLTDAAIIQSVCRGNIRNEGYTDSKGAFSVDLNSMAVHAITGAADDPGVRPSGDLSSGGSHNGYSARDMRDCDLQAVLPGFTSEHVELASKMTQFGNADVGTIVLHRLGHVEGFTISATTAMAPGKAKKLYEQGREDVKKNKLDAAEEKFFKAVQVYPKYAVAWYELGRVQEQKHDLDAARNSFHQSIAADRTYISPYEQLAQIAMQSKQWKDLADNTDELLRLNPVSFPQYWLYNSVANYYLQNLDKAQSSAEAGLKNDPRHQVPKLEYILGVVLAQKHDYPNALVHVRNYIRLVPNAPDIQIAQQQASALEKASGTPAAKN